MESNLTGQLLIAMPNLADPNFTRSVTLICEHSPQGTMGVIINQPINLTLEDLLTQLDIEVHAAATLREPVYFGGPVQTDRGFILHDGGQTWKSSLPIRTDLYLTTSIDILADIVQGKGPANFLVTLGYAGWCAGQLEAEIAANSWLTSACDASLLFHTPIEQRWLESGKTIGIDLRLLSDAAGHA